MFAQTSLSRGERIGIAIMIGIGAAALSYVTLRMYPEFVARDYTYSWRAAQALLHGQNPYLVIRPVGSYPYENYYYYPLPAAFVTLPLVWLPAVPSAAVFVGLSSTALAFAVTRDGFGFRGLLVFASVPYLTAAVLGQAHADHRGRGVSARAAVGLCRQTHDRRRRIRGSPVALGRRAIGHPSDRDPGPVSALAGRLAAGAHAHAPSSGGRHAAVRIPGAAGADPVADARRTPGRGAGLRTPGSLLLRSAARWR